MYTVIKLVDFPVCILSLNKLTPFHYINDIFGRNISLTVKKFFNAVFAILNTDKKWKKCAKFTTFVYLLPLSVSKT